MRKVIITKSSHLVPFNDLSKHPGVKKCWLLPLGYTLIEIDDPILSDGGGVWPASRQRAGEFIEESLLFTPFYSRIRSLADIMALHIRAQTVSYHLVTTARTNLDWPKWNLSANWDSSRLLYAVCRFSTVSADKFKTFIAILQKWRWCMYDLAELRHLTEVPTATRRYVGKCEFRHPAGDATMALFMLLSDTRAFTALNSISFVVQNDFRLAEENVDRDDRQNNPEESKE